MAGAPFFSNYFSGNTAWDYSGNAGGSYTSPATNSGQVAGPVGTERYRHIFQVPAGYGGTFAVTVSGDIFDNSVNTNAQVWYDGVLQGNVVPLAGPAVFNLPVSPGPHTFELYIGGSDNAGVTAPVVTATYDNVTVPPIPCDCCPLAPPMQPRMELGPELLGNGDFEQSTGIGATSSIGPIWQTDYIPCGPNIFAAPCTAGRYSFFTTNAGQVTGNPVANRGLYAKGTRSMAVNVSSSLNDAIIRWVNVPLVNGQQYRFSVDAGCMGGPFGVRLMIDGVQIGVPLPAPNCTQNPRQWQSSQLIFTWTGTTGNHTVHFNSSSTVFGGNDHVFDNFSLTTYRLLYPFLCDGEVTWYDSNGIEAVPAP